MHIQHDVARFAVRQGMWTVVKNLCKGYRDFHKAASLDPSLLRESVERVAADADAADAAREAAAAAAGESFRYLNSSQLVGGLVYILQPYSLYSPSHH